MNSGNISDKRIKIAEDYAKKIMQEEIAHDFKHVDRVRNWALKIAKEENFKNLEMVEISALLHDIGLSRAGQRSEHGQIGADMAEKFLLENSLMARELIYEICNAIRFHNKNRDGEGELLNILRDADMMDLFGAVGIMRAFISKSSKREYNPSNIKGETWKMRAVDFDKRFDDGAGIGDFITDQINFQISCFDNLSTNAAKQLARPLFDLMSNFLIQLEIEVASKID